MTVTSSTVCYAPGLVFRGPPGRKVIIRPSLLSKEVKWSFQPKQTQYMIRYVVCIYMHVQNTQVSSLRNLARRISNCLDRWLWWEMAPLADRNTQSTVCGIANCSWRTCARKI